MLRNGVMSDGQWHEPSTRYHGRVLGALIPLAYALRQAGVINLFEMPELKKFIGWYRFVQTPPDRTMGGCSLTPALSDGNWETVWEVVMGWAAPAYATTDPLYAAELWAAWRLACSPAGIEPSPSNHLAAILFLNFSAAIPDLPPPARQPRVLSGYAVLQPPGAPPEDAPYMVMSTSTQRQTEGHEHPDRGSISMYHQGTPIILDPGDGWCGYNWFEPVPNATFDNGVQITNGAWYRGSESHSLVQFGNSSWVPEGGFGHEWGLRGPAWVDRHYFTDGIGYVDLNITRAVQISQLPGVQGYHRRVFANWDDGSYLLWDMVDAPEELCAQAVYNLHVVTELGLDQVSRCNVVAPSHSADTVTPLECAALNNITVGVTIVRPAAAHSRGLLKIRPDPLPVQFTGMTGVADGQPGGAFGGDWNSPGNLPPKPGRNGIVEPAHWLPRLATWIELQSAESEPPSSSPPCAGFITLIQPRNSSAPSATVTRIEEFPNGSATVEVAVGSRNSVYLLGTRDSPVGSSDELQGTMAVVSSQSSGAEGIVSVDRVTVVDATVVAVPHMGVRINASSSTSLDISQVSPDQYRLVHRGTAATVVKIVLPWQSPLPRAVNVWRGAHVWHITNATGSSALTNGLRFEVLPGESYLLERQCQWSNTAGYGSGGWLCDLAHD